MAWPSASSAVQTVVTRLRGRHARLGPTAKGQASEAARVRAALDMHELGVKLYRQRMRREHPQASRSEVDGMVRVWLAEPPRGPQLRLPSRERDRGTG